MVPMRIISWNVNGIRSVYKRNFLNWLPSSGVDILCLQEIKARQEQLSPQILNLLNYNSFFHPAIKKGYSGVAVYSNTPPLSVKTKLGLPRFDDEGRAIELVFSKFILLNLYIPHGGREKENLGYKLAVFDFLVDYLKQKQRERIVLVGDFNIAHTENDLARPKANQNNIMFTPEERKQVDRIINLDFIDCFRRMHPHERQYTWWPYRANARTRNVGWRIDYTFISGNMLPELSSANVLANILGSDHCPIELLF